MAWEGSDLQQLHLKEWTYLYSKWGVGRLVMLWLILNSVIMIIKQLVSVKSSMCKDTYTHRQIDRQKDKQADRQTDRYYFFGFLQWFYVWQVWPLFEHVFQEWIFTFPVQPSSCFKFMSVSYLCHASFFARWWFKPLYTTNVGPLVHDKDRLGLTGSTWDWKCHSQRHGFKCLPEIHT